MDSTSLNVGDPSPLAIASVERAVACIRELYDAKISALTEAARMTHDDMVRVPTLLDRASLELKTLIEARVSASEILRDEKINAVGVRFADRDRREEKLLEANKEALANALSCARELVNIQNTNFAQQVTDVKTSFGAQIGGLGVQFTDLKDRFNALQGAIANEQQSRANRGPTTGIIAAGIGALMFIMAVVGVVISIMSSHASPPLPPAYYSAPGMTLPYGNRPSPESKGL